MKYIEDSPMAKVKSDLRYASDNAAQAYEDIEELDISYREIKQRIDIAVSTLIHARELIIEMEG